MAGKRQKPASQLQGKGSWWRTHRTPLEPNSDEERLAQMAGAAAMFELAHGARSVADRPRDARGRFLPAEAGQHDDAA